jgi:hypothetical protein
MNSNGKVPSPDQLSDWLQHDIELLKEYAQLIADFEAQGYSMYLRAPANTTKSVAHQHTHLIKY